MAVESTVAVIVGALCGGAGTKVLDYIFGFRKTTSDVSLAEKKAEAEADAAMRSELRAEAKRARELLTQAEVDAVETEARYRATLKRVEDEREDWRVKYYESQSVAITEKHSTISRVTADSLLQLSATQAELDRLRDQVVQLQRSNDTLTARLRATNK